MKGLWRDILNKWKETSEGKRFGTLPKEIFPTLLNRLLNKLTPTVQQNLISDFRACGIYPVDINELLKRLPVEKTTVDPTIVGEAFLECLENKHNDEMKIKMRKKKKVTVPAGQGITLDNVLNENGDAVDAVNEELIDHCRFC